MNLPIPRRRDPQAEPESDLDRWPSFANDLLQTVHDVVPLADIAESDDGYLRSRWTRTVSPPRSTPAC